MTAPTYCVYRCWDADGELLYVGYSERLNRRLDQHHRHSRWWTDVADVRVTNYENESAARRAEAIAIHDERPRHNRTRPPEWLTKERERHDTEPRPTQVQTVTMTHAKAKLAEVIRDAEADDVVLVRRGRPAAVFVDYDRWEALLERLDDAEDRLAVHEVTGDSVSLDEVESDLGLERSAPLSTRS